MATVTSVELNYLVFRYLQESGFTHSAFAFGYEANINKSPIDGSLVPPGALVKFLQKGLQYLEMEANLSNCDAELDEDFSFLQPMDLITKDVHELRKMINERRKRQQKDRNKESEKEHEGERKRGREKERREREKECEKGREKERREKDKQCEKDREKERREREKECEKDREKERREREKGYEKGREKERRERLKEYEKDKVKVEDHKDHEQQHGNQTGREMFTDQDKISVRQEENRAFGGPEPMDISTTSTSQPCEFSRSDVTILEGHTSEVCTGAWSPTGSLLASGSGDATARIWTIAEGRCKSGSQSGPLNVVVLKHLKGRTNEKNKDVTTLDWNGEGTLLATGSTDGQARIWSTIGELRSTLSKHMGSIFSLKWNKKGDYLLTGSCDQTAIVWDVKAEECKQQFGFHLGPTLDVDWRNNVSFATSSADTMIHVCKIGENRPIKTFAGHKGEVNCVKWDPTGSLLASCSDDKTAKVMSSAGIGLCHQIWSMKHDKCVQDLREHSKEIYTIRWSPTGPGTNNPNKKLVLASASFDNAVKLWDVELGKPIYSLNGHRDHVYCIAFSPNGEYLASGSPDRSMHIWSLKEGKIVKTYNGKGGIFEVCWNKEGNKIAACFASHTVCVMDFRM